MYSSYKDRNERPIRLDEIKPHWPKLCFEATMGEEECEDGLSFMDE